MKLYLMLVPTVAGSRLLMFDDKTLEGYAFINAMLKLFCGDRRGLGGI